MANRSSLPPGLVTLAVASLLTFSALAARAHAAATPYPSTADAVAGPAGIPYITDITYGRAPCDTCPPRVCPGEPVLVTISGSLPNGCVHFRGLHELPVAAPFQAIAADFVVDSCGTACTQDPVSFTGQLSLPIAAPGSHPFELVVRVYVCPDTSVVGRSFSAALMYEVLPECVGPTPLDSLVRSFTALRIVPEHPCAGDSIALQLVLNGCPPCVDLTGLGFDPLRGLLATFDWTPGCLILACRPETLSVSLGQFTAGTYELSVTTDAHVLGTPVPDSIITFVRTLGFVVPRTCDSALAGCLHAPLPPFGTPIPECAVRIPSSGTGEVLVPVRNDRTGQGIAGVQGDLFVEGPFFITGVGYAGAAPGVNVSWRHDGPLVRFVLFGPGPDVVPPGTSNLLRVRLVADSLPVIPPVGHLRGQVTLASDPQGAQVPLCPEPAILPPSLPLCIDNALASCDVNHDGATDVRDLVLLTHCLPQMPGDSLGNPVCFDCDGDGRFGIPDLFCCAREVLHTPPGVPIDSARVEQGLTVSMDPPEPDGEAIRLAVHVRGAAALGGALLRVSYPADRWQLVPPAADAPGFASGWLPLVDGSEAGLVQLGALRISPTAADELVFELRASPVPGAAQSGSVSVQRADLTAPDGALLRPASPLPSADLTAGAATEVGLSSARPNPFTRSTSFTVSLPREADVDLAVHDLAGRRVATLAHGRLAAGQRTYTWAGAGVRDGVYFVRPVVDGRVYSSRVALLRDGR